MEFSLLGAALLALAAAYGVLRLQGRDDPDAPGDRWDVLLTSAIVGLAVGRAAAMVGSGTNPLTHPGDLLIIRGGVDTGFAAAGALAIAALRSRHALLPGLDSLAPAAVAGLAGWHAGCLLRGACAGTPTGLPWGITAGGGTVARHPVEVYAALLLIAAAVALFALRRRLPAGTAAGMALAAVAGVRLATEPLRLGIGSGPVWWYVAGSTAGLALAGWEALRSRRGEP